jgi:hypothetical protein
MERVSWMDLLHGLQWRKAVEISGVGSTHRDLQASKVLKGEEIVRSGFFGRE